MTIDSFVGGNVAEMNERALLELVNQQLGRAKFVTSSDPGAAGRDPTSWGVTVAAQLGEPKTEEATSTVEGGVALRFRQKRRDGETFEVQSIVKSPRLKSDLASIADGSRKLMAQALANALSDAAAIVEMTHWSREQLVQLISTPGSKQAFAAARLLVSRQDNRAIAYLVQQLSNEDFDVVRQAVGLLVELKSTDAIGPLIEASRGRDASVQREVIFAIGAIGGEEAMAYLDLIATGHDDARLRAVATQALGELRERTKRKEAK